MTLITLPRSSFSSQAARRIEAAAEEYARQRRMEKFAKYASWRPPWRAPTVREVPLSAAERILWEVASAHELTPSDLTRPDHRPHLTAPRYEAFWRLRSELGWSYPRVGRFMKRDHSTVVHGCQQHKARMAAGEQP